MKYLFLPLKQRVAVLPAPRLHRLSVTLVLAAAADWCVNLYRLTAPRPDAAGSFWKSNHLLRVAPLRRVRYPFL